ncbi:hypothetical protein MLD38_012063 [Melastoma candidum]|uniref:Uncharacterized protein n=1 Tax=Melastoma candidum TaxID=119954 RepID=A0ACB9R5P8_9MYRT|nr:hypothetical protein MLD38_012063 [Melastoma candidum]
MSLRVLGPSQELEPTGVANLELDCRRRGRGQGQGIVSMVASGNVATAMSLRTRKDGRKVEYERSVSSWRLFAVRSGYLGMESLYLLIGLTASLLILPLLLPPLPPPPLMLLLLPICILACLMILALMPSNFKDLTYM